MPFHRKHTAPRVADPRARGMIVALALVGFLAAFSARAQEAFIIIVHPSVAVSDLSIDQASDCFLKKMGKWGNGTPMRPVTLADRETTEAFDQAVHDRNSLAVHKYWQRQVFTGRGTPPLQMKTPAEVLEYVSNNPGAIGYVPAGTKIDGRGVQRVTLRAAS